MKVKLTAAGYKDNALLGKKFNVLYKLCEETSCQLCGPIVDDETNMYMSMSSTRALPLAVALGLFALARFVPFDGSLL